MSDTTPIPDADLKAFKERAGCIVNQFNGFEVEKGLNENGSLVQGESIGTLVTDEESPDWRNVYGR